jgi:hypothetical protein
VTLSGGEGEEAAGLREAEVGFVSHEVEVRAQEAEGGAAERPSCVGSERASGEGLGDEVIFCPEGRGQSR